MVETCSSGLAVSQTLTKVLYNMSFFRTFWLLPFIFLRTEWSCAENSWTQSSLGSRDEHTDQLLLLLSLTREEQIT